MTNTEPTLTDYDKIIQGLEIFKKYPGHPHYASAEHDEIYAGPRPSEVSEEDLARLTELGWHGDSGDYSFVKYV